MTRALASIPCGPSLSCPKIYGYLTIVMAVIIFVGSIYLLLSAVFGPRMGYLVVATAFFGWMFFFSGIWVFGAHLGLPGVTTPRYQGPRGVEPHWQPIGAGVAVDSTKYPAIDQYPAGPWKSLGSGASSSVQSVSTSIQEFMAERANEQLGISETSPNALLSTDFSVEDVKFTTSGNVSLAAARAFYNLGGPKLVVLAYHDSGSVPMYSWAFFLGSIFGLAVHVPFLDRAERKRKAVLTGGARPPWYGPA